MLNRRSFLTSSGAGLVTALAAPRLARAAVNDNRLVIVILRGGMDGLHALPPRSDPRFRTLRPNLSEAETYLPLETQFGLHPALSLLRDWYTDKNLLFFPAIGTRAATRSHVEAQNILETGTATPFERPDGWLARALQQMQQEGQTEALAFGPTLPLMLQGNAQVENLGAPDLAPLGQIFLDDLAQVYQSDPLFQAAFADGRKLAAPETSQTTETSLVDAATQIATRLRQRHGARIAVLEQRGWDTHADQASRMRPMLTELSDTLASLQSGLGEIWQKTAVAVVSEFGRAVAENTTFGTDHGTGGLAILAGGRVKGGRIVGSWPGLAPEALLGTEDLATTSSYEGLFKTMLIEHMGLNRLYVEDKVFPNSASILPVKGLLNEV